MNRNQKFTKEPDFPRPSSAIARGRLQNRLICGKNKKEKHKEKSEHLFSHDLEYSNYNTNNNFNNNNNFDNEMIGATIGYPSSFVESSTWFENEESRDMISTMKSNIIPSHSLMVPGIETLQLTHSQHNQNHQQHHLKNSTTENYSTSHYMQLISNDNIKYNASHHNTIEQSIRLILNGTKEFCYLEIIDPINPYKLSLTSAPSDPSNPRYITLSKHGIIRHWDGESDSTSLKSFLKEYYIYHQIIKIPIFKQFWEW